MKATNTQLIEANVGLAAIGKKKSQNTKLIYRLARNKRLISNTLKDYGNARQSLVDEYSEKDEKGNPVPGDDPDTIKLTEGKIEEFGEKIKELQNIEIDIDTHEIEMEMFEEIEGGISADEIMLIDWMIVEK
jgi:hypothetical protein